MKNENENKKLFSPKSENVVENYTRGFAMQYGPFKEENRLNNPTNRELFIHFNKKTRYTGECIRTEGDSEIIERIFELYFDQKKEIDQKKKIFDMPFASFSKGKEALYKTESRNFYIEAVFQNAVAGNLHSISHYLEENEILNSGCNDLLIDSIVLRDRITKQEREFTNEDYQKWKQDKEESTRKFEKYKNSYPEIENQLKNASGEEKNLWKSKLDELNEEFNSRPQESEYRIIVAKGKMAPNEKKFKNMRNVIKK